MKKEKEDLISDAQFIKLNRPKKGHHYTIPSDAILENDENDDQLIETLIGMEYDIESIEDINQYDDEQDEEPIADENKA
jgi:hypothetical protein